MQVIPCDASSSMASLRATASLVPPVELLFIAWTTGWAKLSRRVPVKQPFLSLTAPAPEMSSAASPASWSALELTT